MIDSNTPSATNGGDSGVHSRKKSRNVLIQLNHRLATQSLNND